MCVLFAGVHASATGCPSWSKAPSSSSLFTALFSWRDWRAEGRVARGLAQTLAVAAIAASLLISWLFESVFLVRLP